MAATPNMGLTWPVPGITAGPSYAQLEQGAISLIDAHDHTNGKGVLIPAAALNINGNLPFGGFDATGLRMARFNSQSGTLPSSDVTGIYVVTGDLYYNNGSGTAVQVTSGGSVAGAAGNISGLASPAAVTWDSVNKIFAFTQNANFPAKMQHGDIILYETVSSPSNAVTLKSPHALASAYSIVFPTALPGSPSLLESDASGNLSFVLVPGNTALLQSTSSGVLSFVTTLPSGLTIPSGTSIVAPAMSGTATGSLTGLQLITPTFGPNDGSLAPTGSLLAYAGATAPTGWLICDGSAVSRATYAALFAIIGTSWGIGDGSTTFNLPDLRGKFPRGLDNTSGTAAGNDPDTLTRTAQTSGTWTLASCTTTNTSPTVAVPTLDSIAVGMHVTGTGIPANTYVRAKSAATGAGNITLGNQANTANVNATASGTVTLTFDKAASAAYLGSMQADQIRSHTHGAGSYGVGLSSGGPGQAGVAQSIDTQPTETESVTGTSAATGGNETHPINAYMNWIIRT